MTALAQPAAGAGGNPFSPRAVLALVGFGALVFVALLWMIGAGMGGGSTNDGGGHAGGKGLNGYAALAGYLERRGFAVRRSQSEAVFDDPALLVLTPEQWTRGEDLEGIVSRRRTIGPTLIVLPKWIAGPVPAGAGQAKQGWVALNGTLSPEWKGFLDDLSVHIAPVETSAGGKARWVSTGDSGVLPVAAHVQSGSGKRLMPLVVGRQDGRVLAAWLDDGGMYPGLEGMGFDSPRTYGRDENLHPLVLVFEPDLLDNYGMGAMENARLAERLVRATGAGKAVNFDLTLNGHARSANLLTLAFTPPFLAATLCLLMAGLAVAWRAFLRFGPPRRAGRAIAFGKRRLVENAAGLVRRTGRLHLIAGPYGARARQRLARSLALPGGMTEAATSAAIDRALAQRQPDSPGFTEIAARLAAARRPHELLLAARELHALERKLTR